MMIHILLAEKGKIIINFKGFQFLMTETGCCKNLKRVVINLLITALVSFHSIRSHYFTTVQVNN